MDSKYIASILQAVRRCRRRDQISLRSLYPKRKPNAQSRETPISDTCRCAYVSFNISARLEAQPRPQRQFELKAESPEFWKLIDRRTTPQKLAGGFGFTEGPVWDPHGFVFVSDEETNKIFVSSRMAAARWSSRREILTAAPGPEPQADHHGQRAACAG